METIKSYTDIEQSRTLAKRLPIESADMHYEDCEDCFKIHCEPSPFGYEYNIPCWSLTSLLAVLPIVDLCTPTLKIKLNHKYYIELCIDWAKHKYISTNDYDNPIDACVAMIIKLHELNLL